MGDRYHGVRSGTGRKGRGEEAQMKWTGGSVRTEESFGGVRVQPPRKKRRWMPPRKCDRAAVTLVTG